MLGVSAASVQQSAAHVIAVVLRCLTVLFMPLRVLGSASELG